MLIFGTVGFFLTKFGFATAPIVLGMVLSDLFENNIRRAVILSSAKGGFMAYFLSRPICLVLAVLVVVSMFSPVLMSKVNKKTKLVVEEDSEADNG